MDDEMPRKMGAYPPYAPYNVTPMPPTVEGTIGAGRVMRIKAKPRYLKSGTKPPRPARPGGPMRMPKPLDEEYLTPRAMKAHARCMRKHCIALTDRLERMAKPSRRQVLSMWREHHHSLPPETIARLRGMLDADEPFKPDQAYQYFTNLMKGSAKSKKSENPCEKVKRDLMAMVGDRRFSWARNATVAFARGIQQRLSRPGKYRLADGMLRLSDIILYEICCYMNLKTPSRRSSNPKAKFMVEMADKIAVWIDEILSESDERLLMMDFDEDEEVSALDAGDDETSPPAENTPLESKEASTTSKKKQPTTSGTTITTQGESASNIESKSKSSQQ
ncbi:uncharacterized protein LOC113230278 isoform X2 [Hyposmocoma kahamanoa]|uniref:uncharacterized protein LOC113230278 isoform X2 n=1 Tax=Hyposmocoma kahamanoa TaxID=1477025 RepID=UPI000E6D6FF5|nr:uncharacterized protein LOC113230278 isoform X2 [Hyposmocoma kahamanoa]